MFVPFSIENHPVPTLDDWIVYVRTTPRSEQGALMDRLHLTGPENVPNFSKTGKGRSLLVWARERLASYTLMQEIALA